MCINVIKTNIFNREPTKITKIDIILVIYLYFHFNCIYILYKTIL